MTSLIAGRAPILDFDGTIARLDVAWSELRARLGLGRIDEVWASRDERRWDEVTAAEIEAARVARPGPAVGSLMRSLDSFAILTSNAERAVTVFLARFPALEQRVALVVGRETLGGPKTDFEVFARGFALCSVALGSPARQVYVGDQQYELDFARQLGADAVDVAALGEGGGG